jgi:hypothetical protein
LRYRHVWPGILLLSSLATLLVALVAWGDHFLSPGPSGGIRRLLDLWATPRVQGQVGPVTPATAEPLPAPRDAAPRAAPADEPAPPPAAPAAASAGDSRAPAAVLSARAVPARLAARYSLDLGTFAVVEDAERAEAQLNQAGFSTVRFRQQEPVRLFTVTLASPPDPDETQAIVSRLREDGFAQTVMLLGHRHTRGAGHPAPHRRPRRRAAAVGGSRAPGLGRGRPRGTGHAAPWDLHVAGGGRGGGPGDLEARHG